MLGRGIVPSGRHLATLLHPPTTLFLTTLLSPLCRYLTLEMLSRMSSVPTLAPSLQQYNSQVQAALRDPDQSIRRKAMDLQVAMCDPQNVQV